MAGSGGGEDAADALRQVQRQLPGREGKEGLVFPHLLFSLFPLHFTCDVNFVRFGTRTIQFGATDSWRVTNFV